MPRESHRVGQAKFGGQLAGVLVQRTVLNIAGIETAADAAHEQAMAAEGIVASVEERERRISESATAEDAEIMSRYGIAGRPGESE